MYVCKVHKLYNLSLLEEKSEIYTYPEILLGSSVRLQDQFLSEPEEASVGFLASYQGIVAYIYHLWKDLHLVHTEM